MKDWTGNKKSVFTTIGAAGHANHARQSEDYYATEPKATELLCELEQFSHDVWEPACGEGHMVKVLQSKGYNVRASDLIDRGGGYEITKEYFDIAQERIKQEQANLTLF